MAEARGQKRTTEESVSDLEFKRARHDTVPELCKSCAALRYPTIDDIKPLDRVCRHDVVRVGPYLVGPRQNSPSIQAVVRSGSSTEAIKQNLVRREGTSRYYICKTLSLQSPEEETSSDRVGKWMIENERSLLSLLSGEKNIAQLVDVVKDEVLEQVSPYSLTCSRRGIKYSGRTEKRISLILDCYVAHDFDTESLKNVNLQYYVIKGQKLPESKALYIFASIADTLKRLHDLNVVHRDIKLANLVLDITTSTVRWINFSYGRHLLVSDEALGEQRGSPAYISPELLTGKTYKGKPADVWAAGVVLYTMLYGTFPFYHPTTSSLLRMIASGVYQIPADGRVSMGTIELIKGMLSHDPNDRMTAGNILERVMSLAPLQRPPASAKRESDQVVPDKEEPSSKGAVPAVVPTWFRPLNTSSPFQPPAPRSSRQSSRERIVTSSDSSSEASAASPNHRLVSVTRRDAAERGLPSFRSQFFRHPTTTTSSGSTTTTSPAVISMMLFRPTPPATSNAANSVANVNRGSDLASSDSSAPPAPAPAPRNVPTTTDRSPAALANAIIGSIRRTPFSSGPSRHAPRNFPPARTPAPSAGSTSFMRALSEPSSPPPPVPSGSTAVVPSGRVARGGQLAVADALGSPVPRSSRTAASYLAPYPYMHQRSEGALIPHNPQDASLMSGPLIDSGTGIGARRPAVGFSFSRGGMVVTHTGRDARRLTTAQEVRELFSNQFRSVGEYGNADPRTDSLATVPDVVLSTGNTASEDVDGTACERASLLRLRTESEVTVPEVALAPTGSQGTSCPICSHRSSGQPPSNHVCPLRRHPTAPTRRSSTQAPPASTTNSNTTISSG